MKVGRKKAHTYIEAKYVKHDKKRAENIEHCMQRNPKISILIPGTDAKVECKTENLVLRKLKLGNCGAG